MKKVGLLLFLCGCLFVSCVRRKDFENIKVERWSPDMGLPLVNSSLKLDDAVKKNKSELIIQYDNDGFITFIYLDTVHTPTGDWLLNQNSYFKQEIPSTHIGDRIQDLALAVNAAPVGTQVSLPTLNSSFNFDLQPGTELSKIIFKEGKLGMGASLDFRQEVGFTLQLPNLKNASGTPFSRSFLLDPSNNYRIVDTLDLTGYSLEANANDPHKIDYTLSGIHIKKISNDILLPTDSFKVDLGFRKLKFKQVEGKFDEQILTGIEDGQHNINVFDNVLKGDVSFPEPRVEFTFRNSYGLSPAVQLDSAKMKFSYKEDFTLLQADGNMIHIPGITALPAQTIDKIGQYTSDFDAITPANSNLPDVLNGAPYRFSYKVPSVALRPSADRNAFITDESKIEIQTKVILPMFGRVNMLEITDTIKDISLPKPENVDFVQFNFESLNSIPVNISLQGYFMDSSMTVVLGKLFRHGDTVIVASGDVPVDGFDTGGNIIKTIPKSKSTTTIFNKAEYAQIAGAKNFRMVGQLTTKGFNDVPAKKNVKFYAWQECTFKLSALVTASVPLDNPSSVTDGLK